LDDNYLEIRLILFSREQKSCSCHLFFEGGLEIEGSISVTNTLEEFVLELDPMETKGVQEALQSVHHHEYTPGHSHVGEPE
jgi:hypothetical protein